MKYWTPMFFVLALLAGCAHLPAKPTDDSAAGLVIVPLVINNSTEIPLVARPFLWTSQYDKSGMTPRDLGLGRDGNRLGDFGISVENAGKRLIQVVHEDFEVSKVVIVANYSLNGDYAPQTYRESRIVRYVPGRVTVADFKFVYTQTKYDGSYYNYQWKWVSLSEREKEAILAEYRADKANAAWFE